MKIKSEMVIKQILIYAFAVQGWTKKELARQAGVSENVLRNIHDPEWNTTLDVLRKLEKIVPDEWAFENMPKVLTANQQENDNAKE